MLNRVLSNVTPLNRVVNLKFLIKKKYRVIFVLLFILNVVFIDLIANEINGVDTIVPLEGIDFLTAKIKFGVGEFNLTYVHENVFKGNFQYEKSFLKPNVQYEVIEKSGVLDLSQSIKEDIHLWPSFKNEWNLKLPSDIPLHLYINTSTYIGDIDLTNLKLMNFYLNSGASTTNIVFNRPNLVNLENINIKTGASTVKILGLAYANFDKMDFTGGAGVYTFDFSGNFTKKSRVNLKAIAAKIILILPPNVGTKIAMKCFPVIKLENENFREIEYQTYVNSKYNQEGTGLEMEITGALIDVEVVSSLLI